MRVTMSRAVGVANYGIALLMVLSWQLTHMMQRAMPTVMMS